MNNHNTNNVDYILKIPLELKSKLCKVLKYSNSRIRFSDFNSKFQEKFKDNLEISLSDNNTIYFRLDSGNEYSSSDKEIYSRCNEVKLKEFEDLMKKIDFTYELNQGIKKKLIDNETCAKIYIEIKITISLASIDDIQDDCSNVIIESSKKLINSFDMIHWKIDDIYPIQIVHMYDPSKIWITFASTKTLQKQLWNFYNKRKNVLIINLPELDIGFSCVALIGSNYYRCKIVNKNIQELNNYKVYLYDFGSLANINVSNLFYLHESFIKYPAFAVRAQLADISSIDNQMWDEKVITRFAELTKDKKFYAKIVQINKRKTILSINLLVKNKLNRKEALNINHCLIKEGLAKFSWEPPKVVAVNNTFKSLRENMYLFPTFEMIENGLLSSRSYLMEDLKLLIPWDVIFPELYEYQDNE